ncbi:hypothetical protein WCD74_01160 [Actinomycetospora sp. OC33-EN08]|uniref:PH domain-containing protein n=1 Tax=Actinomycetospora aurantiaca TaxID=3129233 RepID=A0ABU8MGX5_9PSEU
MPARPVEPPPGRGPVLAGESGSVGAAVLVVGGIALAVVLFWMYSFGEAALVPSTPRGWVFLALMVALFMAWFVASVRSRVAVGADWLMVGRQWVDLYDLTAVRTARRGLGLPVLRLEDGSGRRVAVPVATLRADPLRWDLVHLGVRWSEVTNEVRFSVLGETWLGPDPLPEGATRTRRRRRPVSVVRRAQPDHSGLPPRPDPFDPVLGAELPRRPQSPPTGMGPVLSGRSGRFWPGVVVPLVLVGAVVVVLEPGWPGTVSGWLVLAIAVVSFGGLLLLATQTYLAAGAGWLADERAWVDLEDLAEVVVVRSRLRLTDASGRRVFVPVRRLRDLPVALELVRVGLAWSRGANVVVVDERAERILRAETS